MLYRNVKPGDRVRLTKDCNHQKALLRFKINKIYTVNEGSTIPFETGGTAILDRFYDFWPWTVLEFVEDQPELPKNEVDYYRWLSERE